MVTVGLCLNVLRLEEVGAFWVLREFRQSLDELGVVGRILLTKLEFGARSCSRRTD